MKQSVNAPLRAIPKMHLQGSLILAISRARVFSLQQFISTLKQGDINYLVSVNKGVLTDVTDRLIGLIYLRDTEGKAKRTLGEGWPQRLRVAFLLESCSAINFILKVEDHTVGQPAYFYERAREYYTPGRLIPIGLYRLIDIFSMPYVGFQIPGTGYRFTPGIKMDQNVFDKIKEHTKQTGKFSDAQWETIVGANYFVPEYSGLFTKVKKVLVPDFSIQQPTFVDGQGETCAIGDAICRGPEDSTESPRFQLLRSSGLTDVSIAVNLALNISLIDKVSAGLNLEQLIYAPVSDNVDPLIDRLITGYWFGVEYDGGQLRSSNGESAEISDTEA